jgi:CO/xanthine dehydrogenase Mo-binding subunit
MAAPAQRSGGSGRPSRPGSGRREASWGQEQTRNLDDWLAIEVDGSVTAFSGKVELGTGVRTALAQIVAEELELPLERVNMVMGDTALTPDEGYTAGSMTILTSGASLREAAAEARRILLELAAQALSAAPRDLAVQDGSIFVTGRPEQRVSYAELMGGKLFNRQVPEQVEVRRRADYRIVGTSVPRQDLPGKVVGQPSFVHDFTLPGMLHARLVRPPSLGATLVSLEEGSVQDLSGPVQVVRRGNFVGVLAEREELAVQAAKRLKVEWREAPSLPAMPELYAQLRSQPTEDVVLVQEGDVDGRLKAAPRTLRATYLQPYHAHASIGPSCAVADVQGAQVTVWSSTAGPFPLSSALAQLLELPPENIHLIHLEGAGSYGANGSDDAAADAALLSQAVGRPVRVQWSREDEFIWEPKAPAMVMEAAAGLDEHGQVLAWDYQVWSPSHVTRARSAAQLLAGQLVTGQGAPQSGFSFGAERNAPTNYAFPVQRVTVHYLADSPLRASSFRSLGGAENTFTNESFIDELASASGVDALEFRLRYLQEPRAREVLLAAARRAGWESRPSPRSGQEELAEGRGLAFARYENDQAIVCCVVQLQVNRRTGEVRVQRITVTHDCGLIINPDGVLNQVEGNILQSLSRALKEEVQFDRSQVTSRDWSSYPILTFSEVPEVDIQLINRPDQPALGAGEPATVTTAAAVANAIFDATGARLRQVPFTRARLLSALPH